MPALPPFARAPVETATPVGRRRSTQIGCGEYALTVASRLYFSSVYRLVYFFMIASSLICVVWTGMNNWRIPTSVLFITLEITVSALMVFEVLLRMMAFKRRFWSKWCNIFDVVALVLSLVSVAMYFNEEGVIGELEEVATDAVLTLRNAVQYIRLAIFLKNRSERLSAQGGKDIEFEALPMHPDDERDERDEREMMLDAESGLTTTDDDDESIEVV